MKNYRFRTVDLLLQYRLEEMGAVLVEGPKWCGKTTTCEQQAKSVIYMDDPQMKNQYKEMADTQVSSLLEGDTPHLIDEWQVAPQLWDTIRFEVDHRQKDEGQFILFCRISVPLQPIRCLPVPWTITSRLCANCLS